MSVVSQSNKKDSNGLHGSKEELRSLMLKAKNEYLSKHQDLVNEYLKIKPDANTLEIINYIQSKTDSGDNASLVSLNCLFILFIGLILIIILRIQYNVYLEDLLLSSLFFSLNPSIDIDLLFNDLTLKINKCTFANYLTDQTNKEHKKWINNNIEYCDFLGDSINRKLLYIYEYSSNKYMQNNADLNTFVKWILNDRFHINNKKKNKKKKKKKIKAMPLNAITNKDDIEIFILSNYEYLKNQWNNYVNQMETNYAKKNKIEVDDVLYRLTIEIIHFIFTNSLYDNYDHDNNNNVNNIIMDIMNIIEIDLQYEYFRDGFICIDNENKNEIDIEFVTISDLMSDDNNSIEQYLNLINDKKMICINTFEQIGRFNKEINIYLKIIEKVLNNWLQTHANGMTVIDKNENIKQELNRLVFGNNRQYWTDYEWFEKVTSKNGISIESLVIHDKLIYANTLLLNTTNINYEKYVKNSGELTEFIDIKYFIKDMETKRVKGLELFYLNNYFFHRYFFEQFKTKEISKEYWSEMSEFIGVINKQFGGVAQLTQEIIKYIDRNFIYYSAGFVWILCNNTDGNNKLYFEHTLRYNNLLSIADNDDAILMIFDLWSHSFYHDFVRGHKLKKIEYKKINKKKYKTKEIIGQAIDIKHIGTSLQKTFNFPRTKMEMFGYFISSLFHNLDWVKIAKRWQMQCKNHQNRKKNKDNETQQNDDTSKPMHQEL